MPTQPTPIRARPSQRDPLRNFKFRARFEHPDPAIRGYFADLGFINISGLGVQTDMIPYREGGDNTTTRKLPGQSDFGPLTFIGGVFLHDYNPQFEWHKQIFSLIWGEGNADFDDEFRCNIFIDVLRHPVTKFAPGGVGDPTSQMSSGMAYKVYNCWPASIVYNDLNAGDNSIMITNMTVYHEGFDVRFGSRAQQPSWAA